MGFLSRALAIPDFKAQAVASAISTWEVGMPKQASANYDHNAREGYMLDELVYGCVNLRANSLGEPPLCAYRETASGEEKIDDADDHPSLALLNRPNPWMGRSRFWATISLHLDIGGNAYIEKVRSAANQVSELWLLRPDRVKVIPDAQTFIGGYTYTMGERTWTLPPENVIHLKTINPLDDFYGMPPLAVLAGRVDIDVWMREFTAAFFRNAGVPAGLLNVQRAMSSQEKEDQRRRFREIYGGTQGWHKVMLIDGGTATYTQMGMPMGAQGLAMSELTQVTEARICGAYGVPPSLLPTLIGANSSSYANRVSDREVFWEQTLVPLFRDIDSALTIGLADEFPDIERWEHDLSTIKALQEDEDKKHARYRDDWKAGLVTWEEARQEIGYPEEPDEAGIVLIPTTMVPTPSDQLDEVAAQAVEEPMEPLAPQPMQPGQTPPQPALSNGRTNGRTNGTGGY